MGAPEHFLDRVPNVLNATIFVIPAQAGNQNCRTNWFPACAGMTLVGIEKSIRGQSSSTRPAKFVSFWHRPCNDSE
jgi:hypothetical protein